MSFFANIFAVVKTHLLLWVDAALALWSLITTLGPALFKGKGPLKARLAPLLARTPVQRDIFAVLRAVQPNLVLSKQLVKAYDNNGSVFVTRAADVIEVLDREADFGVVYGPKMIQMTGGDNFFLGMQDSAEYQHDVSMMRLVMRREDVESIVAPLARAEAERLLAAHPARVDLPPDLTTRVPAKIVEDYFGIQGVDQDKLIETATVLFWWMFQELTGDPAVEARAMDSAKWLVASVDDVIARRRASGDQRDDLVGRALTMQKSAPEFTDRAIRNNLIGIIIGCIPSLSKASVHAIDELLSRPDALAGAHAAALRQDDAALGAYVFEALRFNPLNPVIYRIANRDTVISESTLRARKVKKGAMVFAANLSAMFDPLKLDEPRAFRVDRPWGDYMLWGYGTHSCFGKYINRAVLPVMLQPLLARANLRRAPGPAGQVDGGDTPPFPQHFIVESD